MTIERERESPDIESRQRRNVRRVRGDFIFNGYERHEFRRVQEKISIFHGVSLC